MVFEGKGKRGRSGDEKEGEKKIKGCRGKTEKAWLVLRKRTQEAGEELRQVRAQACQADHLSSIYSLAAGVCANCLHCEVTLTFPMCTLL